MAVKGGRLEFLVPHLLRSQLLRPGFVRVSLRLGGARQMPAWAKLQFTNAGVSPADLDRVLRRVTSLDSWVDEWESLGREHEQGGHDALALGRAADAAQRYLAASAAYNFAQYVMFLDINRKRALHEACVRAYSQAAPLLDPPAIPFEVPHRRRLIRGYLRVPRGSAPAPVVVLFHGTNGVKEELHWWGEALLERGLAAITFDGPGLGATFYRLSMVAEPRPAGSAILNHIEAQPELDPDAVGMFGMSLGGYLAIRMACHDSRVKAVAAVSPPYSADIYWNVTLAGMRREFAALYDMEESKMGGFMDRITLAGRLDALRVPLMISGGGRDVITPGSEAWRIFEEAPGEREMVYYPRGAHDCFNVLADLRPRMAGWLARQLERHHHALRPVPHAEAAEPEWIAAEAVDTDFADALSGQIARPRWERAVVAPGYAARWGWEPAEVESGGIEVVHRLAHPAGGAPARPGLLPA